MASDKRASEVGFDSALRRHAIDRVAQRSQRKIGIACNLFKSISFVLNTLTLLGSDLSIELGLFPI
jgi:hypothetical protein